MRNVGANHPGLSKFLPKKTQEANNNAAEE